MRIAAACAGIGVAVGAVLVGLLRLAAGADVLGAAGLFGEHGMPRRYVDYLPTYVGAGSYLRVLAVFLGSGLLAGLLIGVIIRVIAGRRGAPGRRFTLVVGPALLGLVLGALLGMALHANVQGRGAGDFGWYAYSPLENSVLYGGGRLSWSMLTLAGALAGLVVGIVGAGALAVVARVRASTSPSG